MVRVPPRRRGWTEPDEDTPVLDAARVPLAEFALNRPLVVAVTSYIWLHMVRPVVLAVVWLSSVQYAWRHFFTSNDCRLLASYGLYVVAISTVMLVMAPARRRAHRNEETNRHAAGCTVTQLARHASLDKRRLVRYQRARRLLVTHDGAGHMVDATDLTTEKSVQSMMRDRGIRDMQSPTPKPPTFLRGSRPSSSTRPKRYRHGTQPAVGG